MLREREIENFDFAVLGDFCVGLWPRQGHVLMSLSLSVSASINGLVSI